jgi:hypothetical protein
MRFYLPTSLRLWSLLTVLLVALAVSAVVGTKTVRAQLTCTSTQCSALEGCSCRNFCSYFGAGIESFSCGGSYDGWSCTCSNGRHIGSVTSCGSGSYCNPN